jgi:cell division protease FtsH
MSERIGMVNVSEREEHMFLGRDLFKGREVSEQTAREIDEEVRGIIEFSYSRAKEILNQHRSRLIALAEALLERETLDAAEIEQIIEVDGGSSQAVATPTVAPLSPEVQA